MFERYICDVFEDMRKCHQTRNYSYLEGLIEEAQSYANRMESALGAKQQVEDRNKQLANLKKEIKRLREERNKLKANNDD